MFQFVGSQKSWSQWWSLPDVWGAPGSLSGRILAFPFAQSLGCPAPRPLILGTRLAGNHKLGCCSHFAGTQSTGLAG